MPDTSSRPHSLTEQEIRLVTLALNARGWTVTDTRMDGTDVVLLARRRFSGEPFTQAELEDQR